MNSIETNPVLNAKFKHGHLEHLSEICKLKVTDNNPFIQLEKWFSKYHEACMLTKWTWNKKSDSPYVYIQHLGIFTDLNKLARRIKNEINSTLEDKCGNYNKINTFNPGIITLGDTLYVDLYREDENYSTGLQVEWITLNETDERRGYEGWKFELNKST